MTDRNGGPVAILTMQDIRSWLSDKAAIEREIKIRQERLVPLNKKIEAAMILAPEAVKEAMGSYALTEALLEMDHDGSMVESHARGRMAEDLVSIVNQSPRHLTPTDIRAALEDAGYRESLQKNPNYLYTVISRSVKQGRIGRYGTAYGPPAIPISPEGEPGLEQPRLINDEESVEADNTARKEGVP